MPRPTFIDVHPAFNSSDSYRVTNEEALAHRALLSGKRFMTTGAIASSGDVLLSALLPCSQKIYAVDHCYGSLSAAMVKALLLDTMGVRAFKALLLEASYEAFKAAIIKIQPELPSPLREAAVTKWGTSISSSDYSCLRKEWINYPDRALAVSHKRLGNVTFIHGDLADLSQFGQMDLLYVSNACGHRGRTGQSPTLNTLSPLVREDGLLLTAVAPSSHRPTLPNPFWKQQRMMLAPRLQWDYVLYARTATPAVPSGQAAPIPEAAASLTV